MVGNAPGWIRQAVGMDQRMQNKYKHRIKTKTEKLSQNVFKGHPVILGAQVAVSDTPFPRSDT